MFRLGIDDDELLKLGEGNNVSQELVYHQYVLQTVTKTLQEHLFFLLFFFLNNNSMSPPNVPRKKETSKHSELVSLVPEGVWINTNAPEQSGDL